MMRQFFFLKVFLLVAFFGFSASLLAAAAGNKPKVAVFDFKTVGDTAGLGKGVAASLRAILMDTERYAVVDRDMLIDAVERSKSGRNSGKTQKTAEELGKIVGADLVAVGTMEKIEDTYTLYIRFADVATGNVVLQNKYTDQNWTDIPNVLRRLVIALYKRHVLHEPVEEQPETKPKPKPRGTESGNWALGGLYSGAALKYVTGGKSAWELRAQTGSGILAMGSRYYLYFTQTSNPRLFCGIEGDYITFKGEESKGAGFAGGAFLGGEVFLTKQIGLLADVGPMYINLAETDYSQSAGNMEYVLNLAIYWHFR